MDSKPIKKKKGPPKGTGGRPRAEVDWSKVDGLCRFHAPANEIADYLSIHHGPVSYDTLDRRAHEDHGITFAEYVRQKHSGWSKIKLRQLQWKTAEGGNVSMQIFLGKQYLGQTDKQEHTSPDGSMSPPTRIEIVAANDPNGTNKTSP